MIGHHFWNLLVRALDENKPVVDRPGLPSASSAHIGRAQEIGECTEYRQDVRYEYCQRLEDALLTSPVNVHSSVPAR